jgi:hypothetical protein
MTPVRVELVTAPDCHLCADAKRMLEAFARDWPLVIQEVAWDSPQGRARRDQDGILFPPGLYVSGVYWGYGRLSRGRFRALLRERAP